MARGVMERFLNPDCLNAWFEEVSDKQYNRDPSRPTKVLHLSGHRPTIPLSD
jgi:hypothetical protein